MRIILMEDVAHVGNMGDIVKVSDGYGRNYLIPKGLGVLATDQRAKAFAHQKAVIDKKKAKLHKEALAVVSKIEGLSLKIERSANADGKLHGSVTNRDVAEAMLAKGTEVDRRKILIDQPIRDLGEYEIEVKLASEVSAKVKLEVIAVAV